MADTTTNQKHSRIETGQAISRRDAESRGVRRWEPGYASPFDFMDRMTEEMDRWFDRVSRDFGFPRRSSLFRSASGSSHRQTIWSPRIEAFQKGDKFIVRAELPGLKKDQVNVELTDEALTIRGERHEEHEEEREGYYHTEREYGEFHRRIPLPEGVIGESAQANFRDGVLEVKMQAAPSEAYRGRRLEIKDGSQTEQKK
jgi:HSP20 family protein